MDFYNFFKSFMGIPNSIPPPNFNDESYQNEQNNQHSEWFRHENHDAFDHHHRQGFNIFTDPLEIHKFFEQQINDIMQSFGIGEGGIFGNFDNFAPDQKFPGITGIERYDKEQSGSLRDQFLKPGFEKAVKGKTIDSDIDGKVSINDLDDVLKNQQELIPYDRKPASRHFFGQSVMSKTVQRPDGTIEIHKTIKDSQGNEEKTITHRKGDKEYTVITKTDRDGKQEREEKLLNLDDNELNNFFSAPAETTDHVPGLDKRNKMNWFDFDRFFK